MGNIVNMTGHSPNEDETKITLDKQKRLIRRNLKKLQGVFSELNDDDDTFFIRLNDFSQRVRKELWRHIDAHTKTVEIEKARSAAQCVFDNGFFFDKISIGDYKFTLKHGRARRAYMGPPLPDEDTPF